MTGPDHYREAERLLAAGALPESERDYTAPSLEVLIAGVGHAVLALAAATAANDPDPTGLGQPAKVSQEWTAVITPRELS
ncbi:hypothetical protein AWW66_03455 [Micromonospora rosaria]|uniref:Uncharacterized protein n=1 Tax=Micromonospora rosaria TaxID=47874 RepID=A0A136PYE2_9ACTN|nr:hypothetical protein [Micromonospora rosaria]KXK63383.1 hypothetical protein AWW66_03455 [Micromonospora rosaria]